MQTKLLCACQLVFLRESEEEDGHDVVITLSANKHPSGMATRMSASTDLEVTQLRPVSKDGYDELVQVGLQRLSFCETFCYPRLRRVTVEWTVEGREMGNFSPTG